MKYLTKGSITAVLSVAAILAGAFGKPGLATFLNNPDTAGAILTGVGSIGAVVAGVLEGVKSPAA